MEQLESWLMRRRGATIQLTSSNVRVPAVTMPEMNPLQLEALRKRVNELYALDVELLSRCCPPGTPEFPDP